MNPKRNLMWGLVITTALFFSVNLASSTLFRKARLDLTENGAMIPAASVSGLYFAHPQAHYFQLGKLGRDQIEDYARRTSRSIAETERWLSSSLAYDS